MFYEKLDNKELEIVKRISKITMNDYEISGNFIPQKSLKYLAFDMLEAYGVKDEELENYKEFVKENYKPKTSEEIYGFID